MTPVAKLASKLLLPLLYINLAGAVASGLWLSTLAQWQLIGSGVAIFMFSPFVLPILMMPAGVFSHYMAFFQQTQQRSKERVMFLCSIGYIILMFSLICTGYFYISVTHVVAEAIYPALIWGACAGMVPFLMWSARDRNNIFIMCIVESAQIAMLVLVAAILAHLVSGFWLSTGLFFLVMATLTTANNLYEEKFRKNNH